VGHISTEVGIQKLLHTFIFSGYHPPHKTSTPLLLARTAGYSKKELRMETQAEPRAAGAPNRGDQSESNFGFLALMAGVVIAVVWIGMLSFKDGMKTEQSKRNGEAWVAWLSEASGKRHESGYALATCAGGTPVAVAVAAPGAETPEGLTQETPAAPAASTANTWGGCLADMWKQKPFADMVNPFTGKAPVLIEKCDPADYTLHGNISIDKSTANPVGSAVPATVSPLVVSDAIDAKLQLTLAVCDKGGYPIKVSDFEF
jgi:hypothetical protein